MRLLDTLMGAGGGDAGDSGHPAAGGTVAVVAPSGPPDPVLLRRGVARLEALGLTVLPGRHLLARGPFDYLAGSDEQRAADLQAAWCDPEVSAVFCARGGYGATRLLGLLDWTAMRAAGEKILIGSSDVTALHLAFGRELGLPTLHGPMPACALLAEGPKPEPESWAHLRAALAGRPLPVRGSLALVPGRAEGVLAGGNLSLLASLCGTRYQPRFAGRLVFLEDVGEEPYRVDRMLTQLLSSGAFDGALGFALGSWTGCGDPLPVLRDRLAGLGVPILAGLPVGHGSPQLSLWLGVAGIIDTESCSLSSRFGGRERAG